LSLFAALFDLIDGKFFHHLAQYFDVLVVYFLEKLVDARCQDLGLENVVLVQFHDQRHVSEHLLLLPLANF